MPPCAVFSTILYISNSYITVLYGSYSTAMQHSYVRNVWKTTYSDSTIDHVHDIVNE